MTARHESFEVGDRPRVELANTSGDIAVVAGDAHQVEVALDSSGDKDSIEQIGDTVVVRPERGFMKRMFSSDMVVRVPHGTEIEAKNASGDVSIEVTAASLEVATASGDLRARTIDGPVQIKVASGDVTIDHVGGSLSVVSASGDLRIRSVDGDLDVKTASGNASIGRAGGSVSLHSASGDTKVERLEGGDVHARTLSGDVVIGVPPRRRIELDMQSMSGDLRNRLPAGDGSPPEATVRLKATSVSGDVTIQPAK